MEDIGTLGARLHSHLQDRYWVLVDMLDECRRDGSFDVLDELHIELDEIVTKMGLVEARYGLESAGLA